MPAYPIPGLWPSIDDKSQYVSGITATVVGMVGTATKGPMNTRTLITTRDEFTSTFGYPVEPQAQDASLNPWDWHADIHPSLYSYGGFAALAALRTINQLYYVRVGDGTEAKATITVTTDGSSGPDAITINALTEGTHGNNIQVVFGPPGNGKRTSYPPYTGTGHYAYRKIRILYYGVEVESFDNVELKETRVLNTDSWGVEDLDSDYVEFVWENPTQPLDYFPGENTEVIYDLVGGLDGVNGETGGTALFDSNVYIYGAPTAVTTGGLQLFANPKDLYVGTICVPGVWNPAIETELRGLAYTTRKDCMYVFDTPRDIVDDYGVSGLVDWKRGDTSGTVNTTTYPMLSGASGVDARTGAIATPWLYEDNDYGTYIGHKTNASLLVPPTGYLLQCFGRNDTLGEPWFAPAWWTRGILTGTTGLNHVFTDGQLAQLQNFAQINTFVQEPGVGLALYSQQTMTSITSALDRISGMRGVLEIQRLVTAAVRPLLGEQNDIILWSQFKNLVEPILRDVIRRRGLEDAYVKADAETTPAVLRNRYEMKGEIYLIPQKPAEKIILPFILLPSGTVFTDVVTPTV